MRTSRPPGLNGLTSPFYLGLRLLFGEALAPAAF